MFQQHLLSRGLYPSPAAVEPREQVVSGHKSKPHLHPLTKKGALETPAAAHPNVFLLKDHYQSATQTHIHTHREKRERGREGEREILFGETRLRRFSTLSPSTLNSPDPRPFANRNSSLSRKRPYGSHANSAARARALSLIPPSCSRDSSGRDSWIYV